MSPERELLYPKWLSTQEVVIEPVVSAKQVGVKDGILCFSGHIYSCLLDAFNLHDSREGPRFPGALEGRLGDSVAIYRAFFGGPAAGLLMEALIASGLNRLVMVGQAGTISPKCRIGDLFLPTWGVREEGTSYHYLPPEVLCRVSENLLDTIKEHLKGVRFLEGGVWTTDAPYRETVDKVQAYARKGVLAVEMECTALMAIAMYRRVKFAAALVITDELFGEEWVQGFESAQVKESQEFLCRVLASGYHKIGGHTDEVEI